MGHDKPDRVCVSFRLLANETGRDIKYCFDLADEAVMARVGRNEVQWNGVTAFSHIRPIPASSATLKQYLMSRSERSLALRVSSHTILDVPIVPAYDGTTLLCNNGVARYD